MSKILVTGGSGFIGYHFHQKISHQRIVNFDILPPTFSFQSTFLKGDIRSAEDIDSALHAHPCDLILHLAGEWRDFAVKKERFYEINFLGTKNLIAAAKKHGVQSILFFSTVAVYGFSDEPASEKAPLQPVNDYGRSKLQAEKVLIDWAREDTNRQLIILRPAGIFGEHNRGNMLRLIRQIDSGLYFNIGKADNIKSVAYVKNVVDATLFLLKKMKPGVHIYNYVDAPQMTVRETAEAIAKALTKHPPISIPYKLVYFIGLVFDFIIKLTGKNLPLSTFRIKKLRIATNFVSNKIEGEGFRPKYSNFDGIKKMVAWYKKQKA